MKEFFLRKVKELLEVNKLIKDYKIIEDIKIENITCDSRIVNKNSLFFCKGENYKEEYLVDSIEKGTVCYISEIKYQKCEVSYFIVTDILKAMAVVAASFYNYPANDLELIGITGTKGKTTTTYFLKNIFETYLSNEIGIISSINISTGKRNEESHLTTPESIDLHKLFNEMRESNIKYTVMEVSSQSYKRNRLYGVEFEYGIFTNIAEDHISAIQII